MTYKAIVSTLVAVLVTTSVPFAMAEIVWQGTPTGPQDTALTQGSTTTYCTVGNTDTQYVYETDFVQGDMEFAYLIDPVAAACCGTGTQPESVTIAMNFAEADLLGNLVQVGVLEAVGGPGNWSPGAEICATPLGWALRADIPGFEIFTIPPYAVAGGELICPCIDSATPYFVVFRILGALPAGAAPDAVRSGAPLGGHSFYRVAAGAWSDLVSDEGWAGELFLNAYTACCANPIATEETTWGQLKAFYR